MPDTNETTKWHRRSSKEPYRAKWILDQLDLVYGMKVLASGELLNIERDGDDGCSCTEWVMELATMVESLHRLIDEKVPGAVRHDVA